MTKTSKDLTRKEFQILGILWDKKKPMLLSEIMIETKKKKIADNSVSVMIRSLIDKGFVKTVGSIVVGKSISRFYVPAMTIHEYAALQIYNIYKSSKQTPNIVDFLSYLCKKDKNNKDELISNIQKFIDMKKKNTEE